MVSGSLYGSGDTVIFCGGPYKGTEVSLSSPDHFYHACYVPVFVMAVSCHATKFINRPLLSDDVIHPQCSLYIRVSTVASYMPRCYWQLYMHVVVTAAAACDLYTHISV